MYTWLAEPYLVALWCDKMNLLKKQWLNMRKKLFTFHCNIPVILWCRYAVCHGVPKLTAIPVPTKPVTSNLQVFPYPWKSLMVIPSLGKGEHECTCGWPRSVPVGLRTFKIETQTCVSNKVQVTRIRRSSTRENTSTCHLIKKSDTNRIWTSSLLHLRPVMP